VKALSTDDLDGLIDRMERAAEQLRSGELSQDAAAGLVEDCAALASEASAELERRSRAAVSAPPPGQDSLL
jgi:hypothetical protein